MKLIGFLAVVGFCLVSGSGVAADYSQQQANGDAKQIWASGCVDFKKGMNEGNFQKALNLDGSIKANQKIKRVAVVRLYMDGWDAARNLKGVINCADMAGYRAADYVSDVDIREVSDQH